MKSITFSAEAIAQLDEWKKSDPKILIKIISLITEYHQLPFPELASLNYLNTILKENGAGGLPKNTG